jgi:hypothetical protein
VCETVDSSGSGRLACTPEGVKRHRTYSFLRQQFSSQGVWYLVGLGVVAVAFSIWLRGGICGFVQDRSGVRLLPVGRKYPGDALGQVSAGARGGMSREPA